MKITYIRIIALVLVFSPVLILSQWQTYNTPVNCGYGDVSVVNSSVLWAAGYNPGTVVRSTNGGANWIVSDYGLNDSLSLFHISAVDANTAWVVGGLSQKRLFKTINGGLNWTELSYPHTNFINKVNFFNANTGVMFVDHISPPSVDTCNYLITRNGGTNWYRSANAPVIYFYNDNAINIVDTSLIVFPAPKTTGGPRFLYRLQGSLDAPWVSYSLAANYLYFSVFRDSNNGIGSGLIDSIFRTTNGGANWLIIAGGGLQLFDGIPVPGTNWAVLYGTTKIMLSYNFGNSFQPSVNVASGLGYGDAKDTNSIWIAGRNGKLYKYNINYIGINQISSEIPSGFVLHQNYPNPFNPSTSIEFELPRSTGIDFTVYDVSGRQVYNVIEQNKQPGKYSVSFNGTGLATGVYFYRMIAGSNSATRKMVLAK